VELELKPELELVSLVTHVELDALELSLNQEDVEHQLSTADMEHSEHGEHVQSDVDQEHKPEHELVSLVTHVELDVLELRQNHDLVEHQLFPEEWELQEHGVLVLLAVVLEHKREPHQLHPKEIRVPHNCQQLLRADHAAVQLSTADSVLSEHGEPAQHDADQEHKREHGLVSLVMHVELDVLELSLNHDLVELQSSTADGERSEHGALAQSPVVWERKSEVELVSLATLVELDVLELLPRAKHADLLS